MAAISSGAAVGGDAIACDRLFPIEFIESYPVLHAQWTLYQSAVVQLRNQQQSASSPTIASCRALLEAGEALVEHIVNTWNVVRAMRGDVVGACEDDG